MAPEGQCYDEIYRGTTNRSSDVQQLIRHLSWHFDERQCSIRQSSIRHILRTLNYLGFASRSLFVLDGILCSPTMTADTQVSGSATLDGFVELCNKHGLLQRPRNLGPDDAAYGFNDEATLL
jgi:hypothetical protein